MQIQNALSSIGRLNMNLKTTKNQQNRHQFPNSKRKSLRTVHVKELWRRLHSATCVTTVFKNNLYNMRAMNHLNDFFEDYRQQQQQILGLAPHILVNQFQFRILGS
jgi:hypothetical protein